MTDNKTGQKKFEKIAKSPENSTKGIEINSPSHQQKLDEKKTNHHPDSRIDTEIENKVEHKKATETSKSKDLKGKSEKEKERAKAKEQRIDEIINAIMDAKSKKTKPKQKIKANANNIKVIIRVRKLLRNEVGKENIVYLEQTVICSLYLASTLVLTMPIALQKWGQYVEIDFKP